MGINDQPPRPLEIAANPDGLRLSWPDSEPVTIPYRALRLRCRCASCVEEMSGRALLDPGSVPDDVHPAGLHGVGNYAIQFQWSDGHSTGIYTFEYLKTISSTFSQNTG